MQITNDYQMKNVPAEAEPSQACLVQASMSQVEMTVWLCVMAALSAAMLFIMSVAS